MTDEMVGALIAIATALEHIAAALEPLENFNYIDLHADLLAKAIEKED